MSKKETVLFCSDCREKNEWPEKTAVGYEKCSFCGKQAMCSDGTGLALKEIELPEEDEAPKKEIFAKIIELEDRQVLITKSFDPEQNMPFLKVESDYSDVPEALNMGATRFALQLGATEGRDDINKIFEEFDAKEAKLMVDDIKAKIKQNYDETMSYADGPK